MGRVAWPAAVALGLSGTGCGEAVKVFPGVEPVEWLIVAEGQGSSQAEALELTPDGDLVVAVSLQPPSGIAGQFRFGGLSFGYVRDGTLLLRVSATDGVVRAQRFLPGAGGRIDLALEPGGDLLVTGIILEDADLGGGPLEPAAGQSVFLARYAASDLAHLWSIDLALEPTHLTGPRLALDGAGGAWIATDHQEHAHVRRHAVADGALLWEVAPLGTGRPSWSNGVALGGAGAWVAATEELGAGEDRRMNPVLAELTQDGQLAGRLDAESGANASWVAARGAPDGGVLALAAILRGTLEVGGARMSGETTMALARVGADGEVSFAEACPDYVVCLGYPSALRIDAQGEAAIAVTSMESSIFDLDTDAVISRFDAAGARIARFAVRGPDGDDVRDLARLPGGGFVLAGNTDAVFRVTGDTPEFDLGDAFLMRLAP